MGDKSSKELFFDDIMKPTENNDIVELLYFPQVVSQVDNDRRYCLHAILSNKTLLNDLHQYS